MYEYGTPLVVFFPSCTGSLVLLCAGLRELVSEAEIMTTQFAELVAPVTY